MNPVRFWLAVFTLLGFAIVVPGWVWWTSSSSAIAGLPTHITFLVGLFLPVAILLTIGSWVQPG